MNKKDVIRTAREVSSTSEMPWNGQWIFNSQKELIQFAADIAAAEREAVIREAIDEGFISEAYAEQFAAALRARGDKGAR